MPAKTLRTPHTELLPDPGVLSPSIVDSVLRMKQLLLRVPEDVHARLAARAAKEGRSINSVATEMLDTAIDVVPTNPQTVVRARAAAAGLLRSSGVEVLDAPSIAMVRDTLRGVTLSAQDLIDEQRGPK